MEITAMFKRTHTNFVFLFFAMGLCILTTACAQTQTQHIAPTTCTPPSSTRLSAAMVEAQTTLADRDCAPSFENIFTQLINIAKNDTDKENRQEFSEFLNWARDQNIINKRQAMELYTRYFSHKFASLPRDYQTCSYCGDLSKIIRAMKAELANKEAGLLKICGERSLYARAAADYDDLRTILEAACKACEAGE
jgi:hypothetical protein